MDDKKYRFVLSVAGRVVYYAGRIISQNNEYILIDEIKLGKIEIRKDAIQARRLLENE